MKAKQLKIMRQLRSNGRETLTRMSRKTGIPVSTIYENMKQFEDEVITKHTCLLDFRRLGYELRLTLLVQALPGGRGNLQKFLAGQHNVNTILRINNGFDFLVEALFRNMTEVQRFVDRLDDIGVQNRQEFYVLEELCRESFLTSDTHLQLLERALL